MLTRWDPFGDIARLQDQMVQMFEGTSGSRRGMFMPPVDIYEEKDAVFVDIAVPGVKADDINLQVENNVLTISGERQFERQVSEDGYRRMEHNYGNFTRSFVLPESVKSDQIDADLRDGILHLRLPKRPEAQARRIEVKSTGGEQRQIQAKANGGKSRPQPGTQQS